MIDDGGVERIKKPFADRLGDERDWKDAVNVRLNAFEDKYFILKEQLHNVQDQLEKLTKKYSPKKFRMFDQLRDFPSTATEI